MNLIKNPTCQNNIFQDLSQYRKVKELQLSALRKVFCNMSRKARKVRKVFFIKYLDFAFLAPLREISLIGVDSTLIIKNTLP